MELHFAVSIEQPYPEVAAVLHEGPLSWLPAVELTAAGCTAEIAIGGAGLRVSRRVVVSAGEARPFGHGVAVPVAWRATEHPERYPTLSGTLRLEPAGPAASRLRLDAHYLPPAGRVGAVADRAALHAVAEGSVAEFANRVADRLARGVRFGGRWEPA